MPSSVTNLIRPLTTPTRVRLADSEQQAEPGGEQRRDDRQEERRPEAGEDVVP